MTPERWQRIHEILARAMELKEPRRSAYLSEACESDCRLRDEVASLLAAHEDDSGFLEAPAIVSAASDARTAFDRDYSLQRIGAYRLTRRIASGGMGTVYHAERSDDAYVKQVAIKFLRADSCDDPNRYQELLRRFHLERQTLANLEHPNIARLLDGGASEDGFPFLVMEYIEGRPIDRYCREKRLTITERLELFRIVCSAVQCAHQNFVVHRDLKPSNILVTPDGQPKLLDFGIAKLLDEAAESKTAAITRTRVQLLTPSYASPEQLRGAKVTTASDVYSLGVILYELLTGVHPFRAAIDRPHDFVQTICKQEPEKPSTVFARVGKTERRRLAGDVDTIILKALRKEPERRYASVEQFSEDIRRHLAGLPVLARPDTLRYRTSKFVRRHAIGTAAGSLMIALLIGAVAATAWSAHEAGRQRDRAREQQQIAEANLERAASAERQAAVEAESARQVADYLVKIFEVSDPVYGPKRGEQPGLETTAGEILKRGVNQIETDLKDQPEIQARMMHELGKVYERLGAYEEAESLLESALDIRKTRFGEEHLAVADTLQRLAEVLLGKAHYQRAESLLVEALAIRQKLLGGDHESIAECLDALGTTYSFTADNARAEDCFEQALAMSERLHGAEHPSVAIGLANRARVLADQGRYAEAEPIQRRALELLQKAHGEEHPHVATAMEHLVRPLLWLGKVEEAERLARQVLEIRIRIFGDEHPEVARSLKHLGSVLIGRRDWDSAVAYLEQALAMNRRLLRSDHPRLASALNDLGYIYASKRDYTRAETLFQEALSIERKQFPEGHPSLAKQLNNLAVVFSAQRKYAEAEKLNREALAMNRQHLGDRHPDIAQNLNSLGVLLYELGKPDEAAPLLQEALDVRREALGDEHESVANTRNWLGVVLRDLGQYDAAEALLRTHLETAQKMFPPDQPPVVGAMTELGILLVMTDRLQEAEPLLQRAYDIARPHLKTDWQVAITSSAMGACRMKLHQYSEAEPLLIEGHTVLKAARGEHHPHTLRALRWLIDLYDAWGKPERSATYRALLPSAKAAP